MPLSRSLAAPSSQRAGCWAPAATATRIGCTASIGRGSAVRGGPTSWLASGSSSAADWSRASGHSPEPIFDADVLSSLPSAIAWLAAACSDHHPFMGFGVKTDGGWCYRGGRPSCLLRRGSAGALLTLFKEGSGLAWPLPLAGAAGHILAEG